MNRTGSAKSNYKHCLKPREDNEGGSYHCEDLCRAIDNGQKVLKSSDLP
jgi:hypothetical protein